eukprot:TRINITY_DN6646_c0_g1_i1.p2 TRINITY_DN6646_c0_g1~~TRINITY_DN6646_c0_g1_i1.p2  ORF type:complete len:122 (+),score=9.00 TRINITY_DN6646_c0_g1_i1:597-962(+)
MDAIEPRHCTPSGDMCSRLDAAVLSTLCEAPGLSHGGLARLLPASMCTINSSVDRLVRGGLVVKEEREAGSGRPALLSAVRVGDTGPSFWPVLCPPPSPSAKPPFPLFGLQTGTAGCGSPA